MKAAVLALAGVTVAMAGPLSKDIPAQHSVVLGKKADDYVRSDIKSFKYPDLEMQIQNANKKITGKYETKLNEVLDRFLAKDKAAKAEKKAAKKAARTEKKAAKKAAKAAKKTQAAPETPAPVEQTAEAPAEQSGFTEDIQNKAAEIKNKAAIHAANLKHKFNHHFQKAKKWLKKKFNKKPATAPETPVQAPETPAPVVAEQSGFTEDIQNKAAEIKNKAAIHAANLKHKLNHRFQKAKKWLKKKFNKKPATAPETPAPAPAPETPAPVAAEQSGFTEDIQAKAAEFKSRASDFKNKAVHHARRGWNWLKNKVSKATTAQAPVEAQ